MSQTDIAAELRRLVRDRSSGRCEYCLISESFALSPHWIDHIIALKHGGQTEAENLAYSCRLCNQHKGSDLSSIDPDTGEIVRLFNPRIDRWADHFQLVSAVIQPLTPSGRTTVKLLLLNQPDRIQERTLMIAALLWIAST